MSKSINYHIPDGENMGQGLKSSNLKLYTRIHHFLRVKFDKKKVCSLCNEVGRSRYEVALKKGKDYSFNLDDYIELCVPCHRKYDYNDAIRAKNSSSHVGLTPWNKGLSGSDTRTTKPVAKIDPVTNEIIEVYPSIKEASLFIGCSSTGIVEAASGKRAKGLCFGFKWQKIIDIPVNKLNASSVYNAYKSMQQ